MSAWQTWAILAAVFAALTAVLAKIGVDNVDADVATFVRTTVILGAIALLLAATGKWGSLASVSRRSLVFLALSGLATGASWLSYFRALKLGNASNVAALDKLSVAMVAVFAVVFLGERLSTTNWLGIALMVVGAALLVR